MKISAGATRIAMIGYGAIGSEIFAALEQLEEAERLVATLVRPGRDAPKAVFDCESVLAREPDCVIECAGHEAAIGYAPSMLRAGVDVILSSVGILADPAAADALCEAERGGGGRALLPAGAVAGLDGLVAASLAGIDTVTYTSVKPPHAWRGTSAESLIDLDHEQDELVFFEGTAREAAADYPKNANVAVAVGLSGIGIDRTRVKLVSSRKVGDPFGIIDAEGAFGRFHFEILALASPANPKTSSLTAFSLLQCARFGNALPIGELLQRKFPAAL